MMLEIDNLPHELLLGRQTENSETFENIAANYPALTTDDMEAIREALNL